MKILKSAIIILLFYTAQSASAQKTDDPTYLKFTSLHNMPIKLMWPATVTDGKCLYAINGFGGIKSNLFVDKVYKYDPQQDTWTIMGKGTRAKAMLAATYLPDTKLAYTFGGMMDGRNDNSIYLRAESLDLQTGEFKDAGAFNPMASIGSWCAAWENNIYVFGGTQASGGCLSSLYQFDPANHQFTKLADMPNTVETTGAIVNGVLYTFGGMDRYAGTAVYDINAYDIKTNTWTQAGWLPEALSSNCVAVYGNLIFVIGNTDDETFLGYFDTFNKKFTRLQSNMQGRRGAGAAVIGNKLYAYGGKSGYVQDVGGGLQTLQCADLSQFTGMDSFVGK